jgi:sulfopyruvate decarboxylase subunit alpha
VKEKGGVYTHAGLFGEMSEEAAHEVLEGMAEGGIDFVSFLPESEFLTAQWGALEDDRFQVVPVSNEGVGISVCAGAWAGGKRPAMMLGASGFPLTTYPLNWLGHGHRMPMLVLVTTRTIGDEHEIYGVATRVVEPFLQGLAMPVRIVTKISDLRRVIADAARSSFAWVEPVAVLMREEIIDGRTNGVQGR